MFVADPPFFLFFFSFVDWKMEEHEDDSLNVLFDDSDEDQAATLKHNAKLKEMCKIQGNDNPQPRVSFEQASSDLDKHMAAPSQEEDH